jgi:redox-sensitive bicupin YhaK (pirin superfamily)
MNLRVVPNSKLFVSEPDPSWFGNGPNEDLAKNSHWTNANWLKSRFHFSFAEYNNPANSQFGVLRVMNDDLVQPARGFGTHPHRNMEIITYIVHGELTHKDSMGSYETLGRGSIQFMTAGKGVSHSEQNKSPTKPLRFIQTWIMPSQGNLTPNYGSAPGILQPNQLKHLVSSADDDDDTATKAPVQIHQDVNAHAAELELNQRVTMDIPKGRQAYLLCIEGSLSLNQGQAQLQKHDACEITGNGASLEIEATQVEETEHGQLAHFLVFTMKEQAGSGRRDL